MTPVAAPQRSRPVILVVDDDPTQRLLAHELLEQSGFEVVQAVSGQDSLDRDRADRPDLIILDVMMPGIDGYELCRSIRADEDLGRTPILMVTGLEDSDSIGRAFEAGATDFVGKPVHWPMLAHRVKFVLRLASVEREMRAARDSAEAGNRAKSVFLANMSHELRTPLNAIIGFSEIMRRNALGPLGNERYAEYISDIYESGVHLLEIVNNVLDLSKVESGRMEIFDDVVSVDAVVRAAVKQVAPRVAATGIDLRVSIDKRVASVIAGEIRPKQILINLLSNAVKFTPEKGVVEVTVRPAAGGEIVFAVRDTGIGISPEDLPRILQPFLQLDDRLNRRYEGTGLGVPLALAMAKLHGGSLTYDSERGRGTTAILTLPPERLAVRASDELPKSATG
jgi:signal transduction histidine kinase